MKEAEPYLGLPLKSDVSQNTVILRTANSNWRQTAEKMHEYPRDIMQGHLRPSFYKRNLQVAEATLGSFYVCWSRMVHCIYHQYSSEPHKSK